MIYPALILSVIIIFELFVLLRMTKDALGIIELSREAVRLVVSSRIEDDEREAFVRRTCAKTFIATFRFALKFLFIGLVSYSLYLLTVMLFPHLAERMLMSLVSPAVIAILTIVVVCYALVRKIVVAQM